MQNPPPVQRATPRSVKIVERIAEWSIRAGGVGTIGAVTLMMVFLFSVAWPLFKSASIEETQVAPTTQGSEQLAYMGLDEEGELAWLLEDSGRLRALRLENGEPYLEADLFPDAQVTSIRTPLIGETFTFGFANGTVCKADIGFLTREILDHDFPEGAKPLEPGEEVLIGEEFFARTEEGSLRRTTLQWDVQEPFETPAQGSILQLDRVMATTGEYYGLLDEADQLHVLRVRETENWMTEELEREVADLHLNPILPEREPLPGGVLLGTGATQAMVYYPDGHLVQLSITRFSEPELVEELTLTDPGEKLDYLDFLQGRSTLLSADTHGHLQSWFAVRPEEGGFAKLTRIIDFTAEGARIEAVGLSHRSRMFLAARQSGEITAWQSTLGARIKSFEVPAEETIRQVAFHPRQDGVVALTDRGVHHWRVDFGHPETTLKSMFTPIWYEGYNQPEHVWQSSSSSDDFEPKLGMWPLVFGTIKATIFAMLFGAPIAVLGALFTSQYMRGRSRATTKTMVELLAGLPSVVLGFLAALVVAPFVQTHLSSILSTFFLTPLVLLIGAYLWQLQPVVKRRQREGWKRIASIAACLPIALFLGWSFGPLVENAFFGGDAEAWLDHRQGVAASGWFFLMLPLAAMIVVLAFSYYRDLQASPKTSLLRFGVGVLATVVIALLLAFALQAMGFDARGGVLDTYVQRNALVVGIAVGLVVLPIVYTLTEDALNEVPRALREASLGAGATQWQTAVRVVLPFATSGIFSALMVGLGRAVGETMIVLMAAGNTPLTEWNVFNGFRTLAANIATEIPEAVVGSAHYRALFFTALILFGMTFVINTFAELVRRHFRSKVKAL